MKRNTQKKKQMVRDFSHSEMQNKYFYLQIFKY